jgi:electron transport complex protein RnfC
MGGLHPRNIGLDTMSLPIRNAFVPHFLYIPMLQNIGAPALPAVSVGDIVHKGDVVGISSGRMSVNVHTALPGKVIDIREHITPSVDRVQTVVIEVDGDFHLGKAIDVKRASWEGLSKEHILAIMQESGLVGMGGAAFPLHVKYNVPPGKRVDTLVINAVECEPFLSADNRIVIEHAEEIFIGISIAMRLLGVSHCVIGLEADMHQAIERMREVTLGKKGIEILVLEVKYPQGSEKQLLKAALGREVPSGGLPADVGALVSNVSSMLALKEAVVDAKPFYERVLTVTGDLVQKPGNYKVCIGTRISDLLDECGVRQAPGKIVIGGPMMGLAQYSDQVPITKGTSGVLVLSKKKAAIYRHTPCVRCGKCIAVCCMGLEPARLTTDIELGQDAHAKSEGLLDCIECGCCSYICPSGRHLAQGIKLGKLRHLARMKEERGG